MKILTLFAGMARAPVVTLIATAFLAASLSGCSQPRAQERAAPEATLLKTMHESCVEAMVRNTCQAMVGSAPAPRATTVVIAGVGVVDATAYAALREAGEAMCSVGRSACESDWNGATCRSARALWSPTS